MLDKTVPFAKLKMVHKAGTDIPVFPLPDGFRFVMFKDGDEADWARIETSVDEFDSEFAALLLFKEQFIPFSDELYRRCLFIETADGEKIATATAWWSFVEGERRAWLHWVSVDPKYQGLGLGKALTS
ncbi:MAG: GNAT family N-acetyltransferase, partial [Oscillospiraceae bacterium]|nr:GNAT family N-acetyltransferase [Oscillospiraceae bacterium]